MRTLGVDIQKSEILWVLIDGSGKEFAITHMNVKRLQLPTAHTEEIDNLLGLQRMLEGDLSAAKIDRIGIVKATKESSVIRAKVECVVQFAAKSIGIPCALVAPQTINAALERKIKTTAGSNGNNLVHSINPKYLCRAAACGWCVQNVD